MIACATRSAAIAKRPARNRWLGRLRERCASRLSVPNTTATHSRAASSRSIDISGLRPARIRARTWWRHSCWCCLSAVEEAFRNLKGDLAIRPVFHQDEKRIEAQIFIAFLAYCMQIILTRRLHALAPGLTARSALEKFAAVRGGNSSLSFQHGVTLLDQLFEFLLLLSNALRGSLFILRAGRCSSLFH